MGLPSAEPLFVELCALRDADDCLHPEHGRRWLVVARWLEAAFRHPGADAILEPEA